MTTSKERRAQAAIRRAIDWAGSKSALAAECRVSDQTIREWLTKGRVPATPARLLAILMAETAAKALELERTLSA